METNPSNVATNLKVIAHLKGNKLAFKKIILAKQPTKEGLCKVYVQIRVKSEKIRFGNKPIPPARIPTDIFCLPKDWSKASESIKATDKDYINKNTAINVVKNEVETFFLNQSQQRTLPDFKRYDQLKKLIPEEKQIRPDLVDYCQQYIDYRISGGTTAIGTITNFKNLKNRLQGFQTASSKRYFFEDINTVFADNFRQYLFDADLAKNTIFASFELLIVFLNHFYARRAELGISLSDQFKQKGWKGVKKSFTKPNPLNALEIQALLKYKPTNDQQPYYDLMILQIHTALRFSDVTRLTKNMVDNDFLVISPQKTQHTKPDNEIEIPLLPVCKNILKKYKFDTLHLNIKKGTYNTKIKEISAAAFAKAKLEEIQVTKKPTNKTAVESTEVKSKLLTSHNLRDTALSMMVINKVDFHTILSIAGQSSYEILKLYVKTDRKYRYEEIRRTYASV